MCVPLFNQPSDIQIQYKRAARQGHPNCMFLIPIFVWGRLQNNKASDNVNFIVHTPRGAPLNRKRSSNDRAQAVEALWNGGYTTALLE
jgi:hypothetical protein